MKISENNCTNCLKHFKAKELTLVLDPKDLSENRYCDKCLEKFKKATEDEKVAVEIKNGKVLMYCYRCGLKTEDESLFMKHDCIKTKATIKFTKSLMNSDRNENY